MPPRLGAMRKIGHIRNPGDWVRQSPQRLHADTASWTRAGSQSNCSSTRFRSSGGFQPQQPRSARFGERQRRLSCALGRASSAAGARLTIAGGRRRRQRRAEVARDQVRVVADDLARIEDVLRVEDLLHFAETRRTAGRPAGGQRPCGSARRRVRRRCFPARQKPPGTVLRPGAHPFARRPGWQGRETAERGAGRGRRGRTTRRSPGCASARSASAPGNRGARRAPRPCLRPPARAGLALHAIQAGCTLSTRRQNNCGLVLFKCLPGPERQSLLLPQLVDQAMEPAADLQRVVALLLHQQHGLGSGGNQLVQRGSASRQGSGAAGPSGRRPWDWPKHVEHGAGGLLQAVEQQAAPRRGAAATARCSTGPR